MRDAGRYGSSEHMNEYKTITPGTDMYPACGRCGSSSPPSHQYRKAALVAVMKGEGGQVLVLTVGIGGVGVGIGVVVVPVGAVLVRPVGVRAGVDKFVVALAGIGERGRWRNTSSCVFVVMLVRCRACSVVVFVRYSVCLPPCAPVALRVHVAVRPLMM